MIIPNEWKYIEDGDISHDEYIILLKFLAEYRNKNIIVADIYLQEFEMLHLKDEKIIFKTDEDIYKSLDICRKIKHKGQTYVVDLGLWRIDHGKDDPKCLSIRDIRISGNGKVHHINFETIKSFEISKLIFNIISVFDEKKIISPEQAYGKRMHTETALQDYIANHDWKGISSKIEQVPKLANDLFIIREGYEKESDFTADFGTILYQLIAYRQKNLEYFSSKDLHELDLLILELRQSELLKVQLSETIKNFNRMRCILLDTPSTDIRTHMSKRYTDANGELSSERKVLKKIMY